MEVGYAQQRESLIEIDKDLDHHLSQAIFDKSELVAFLPYRNDLLINYLSSKLGVRTYNIGGDKSLENARQYWPETMRSFLNGKR